MIEPSSAQKIIAAVAAHDVSAFKASCPACHEPLASFFFHKDGYNIFHCSGCDFIFVHPYPDNESLTRHYALAYREASADFYPKAKSRRWRGFWRSLRFANYVMNKDVLDLGCGGGFMVEAFSRLGARVSGVDISQNSISYARKRFQNCDFYCESLADFRGRGLSFDFVFSSEVLEHLPGPVEFMETVAAVTRYGGYVYVSAPDAGHLAVPSEFTEWDNICPPEHLQWFNHENLMLVFRRYGFNLHKDYRSRSPTHSVIFKRGSP